MVPYKMLGRHRPLIVTYRTWISARAPHRLWPSFVVTGMLLLSTAVASRHSFEFAVAIQRSPGRFLVSASPYDSLSQRHAEMASVDSLDIRPIPASATINVRHAVLWPDAPLERVLLSEDDGGVHFGAFLCGKDDPLAVISLFQENIPAANDASEYIEVNALTDASTTSTKIFRFRKFACYQSYQGQGIGSALLRHALLHARTGLGASVVWCDARTATQDWYRKRGLVSFTKPFYKHSVEYIRMKVVL